MNRATAKVLQAASARVLPPNYRQVIDVQWHRAFTWRERLKILLGWAIVCDVTVYTEHKPGKWFPEPKVTVTKETDPERAAIECGPAPETT